MEVGRLARFECKSYKEFADDVDALSKYVIERNGENATAELKDANWREQQTHDLFNRMQAGRRFSELVTSHPLLQNMVYRGAKNEANLDFIRTHVIPSFLKMVDPAANENLARWSTELHAACVSPAYLEEQIKLLKLLPAAYAMRLLEGKKTISMDVWKLALKGEFTQLDILSIVACIRENRFNPESYFAVRAMQLSLTDENSKRALIYKLEGNPNPVSEFVQGEKLEAIEELANAYHVYFSKHYITRNVIEPIIQGIGDKPTKEQLIQYFAFRYLVLIHDNKEHLDVFRESTLIGLTKLSEDPKVKKNP